MISVLEGPFSVLKSLVEAPFVDKLSVMEPTNAVLTIRFPVAIVDQAVRPEELPFAFFRALDPVPFVCVFSIPVGPLPVVLAVFPPTLVPDKPRRIGSFGGGGAGL